MAIEIDGGTCGEGAGNS